jgi:hypothetical protein
MTDTLSPGSTGAAAHVVRTPSWPVLGAAVVVGLSAIVALVELLGLRDNIVLSFAGYLLATLGAALFVVLHRGQVQGKQRDRWYVARPQLDTWAARLLAGGLVLGLVHAYVFATEIAKRTGQ